MAEITIKFRRDATTGKREIVIHLESDPDAMPHEHEKDHKALVESILGMPVTEDMGEIVVERVQKEGQKTGVVEGQPAAQQGKQTVKNPG